MAFSEALYLAFPFWHNNCTPAVLRGVGIFNSIFWAKSIGLNVLFITTLISILALPISLTKGITLKGREISLVVLYLKYNASVHFMNSSWDNL